MLPECATNAIITQGGVREKIKEWKQIALTSPTGLIDDEHLRGLSYVMPNGHLVVSRLYCKFFLLSISFYVSIFIVIFHDDNYR